MAFTNDDLKKVARLCALDLPEEAVAPLIDDLNKILSLVNQIQAVNTEGILPLAHPLDLAQRLREDEVTATDAHRTFQQLAPSCYNDHYLVPAMLSAAKK